MKAFAAVLLALTTSLPAYAAPSHLTTARKKALRALCPIAMRAGEGVWGDNNLNGAIATIDSGQNWPDNAQATAFKVCKYGGYLD